MPVTTPPARIVYCEPDPANHALIKAHLELRGLNIVSANDQNDMLEKLHEIAQRTGRRPLAILDASIHVSLATMNELKNSQFPFLVTTALPMSMQNGPVFDAAKAVYTKPFAADVFSQLIDTVIELLK